MSPQRRSLAQGHVEPVVNNAVSRALRNHLFCNKALLYLDFGIRRSSTHLPLLGQNQGKSEEIKPKSFSDPQDIPACHTVTARL